MYVLLTSIEMRLVYVYLIRCRCGLAGWQAGRQGESRVDGLPDGQVVNVLAYTNVIVNVIIRTISRGYRSLRQGVPGAKLPPLPILNFVWP